MMTTGKRYLACRRNGSALRILDAPSRAMPDAVRMRALGHTLGAWLIAMGRRTTAMLLLLLGSFAFGQGSDDRIIGRITNDAGQPLPFVNVAVEGTTRGTVTDMHGQFMVDGLPQGVHVLVSSCIGFTSGRFSATVPQGDGPLVLQLAERVVELPAFTVQNSITGGSANARKLTGSAWYLTPREIQQHAYTDISRLLRTVPGVNIQEEDGLGLRPNIGLRGAAADRSAKITVMEDGILVAPAPYTAPAAYYFPVTGRMHGIEVVKGSSQVRYGPLTTGGALNLLSTPVPENSSGLVGLWGGAYGTRNLRAHAGTKVDGIGMLVETFQQATNGFKVLDNNGPTGTSRSDYLAKLTWQSPDKARIQQALALKAGYTSELGNETYLGLTNDDFAASPNRRYAGSQMDRMDVEHDLFTAQYAITLPGGPRFTATAYRTNTFRNWYKLDQVIDSSGTKVNIAALMDRPALLPNAYEVVAGGNSADNALMVKANNRNYQSSGIQFIASHSLERARSKHDMEAGVRLHSDLMDRFQHNDGYRMNEGTMFLTMHGPPGSESNRLASANAIAAHALYDLSIGRWGLHPGMRYEHIALEDRNYGSQDPGRVGSTLKVSGNTVEVWIPGMGVDVDLHETVNAFGGVHKGFSPPGTLPDIRPESSVNYEAGLRMERSALEVQIIGFLNDYSELLGSDMAAAGGTGSGDLFNAGRARVQGVELYLMHDPLRVRSTRWRMPLAAAYTYTDARFGSSFLSSSGAWGMVLEGDRMPYVPVHQVNLRAGLESRRASISANVNHVAEMAASTGPSAGEARTRIPGHTVLDIAATFRWTAQAECFATAQNLLNESYLVSLAPAGARPGAPRMLMGGVRFRF